MKRERAEYFSLYSVKDDGYGFRTLPNAVSARLGIIFKNFKDE